MSDRAALLATICANPDEDTPRLVYADWLDEHGEGKRAAFIRAQIEYHRRSTADTPSAAVNEFLVGSIDAFLDRIDWSFDAELAACVGAYRATKEHPFALAPEAEGVPQIKGLEFFHHARGFFDGVRVDDATAFLKHADAIFRAAPVTTVNFCDLSREQAVEFVASGHLAGLRELFLSVESEAVEVLGNHRDAAGVRALCLFEGYSSAPNQVSALAAGKHWTGLERLEVAGLNRQEDELEDGHLAELFSRPQFRALRALSAFESGVADGAVRALVENLTELHTLYLGTSAISEGGCAALTSGKGLRHLRHLDVNTCGINGTGAAALINTPHLPNLLVLRIDSNDLNGLPPEALAQPGRGPGLRVLDLNWTHLTADAVEAIVACPAVRDLWYLGMFNAGLKDDHLKRFNRKAVFERLTCLNIKRNKLTSRGAKALATWPGAASLQWLDIAENGTRNLGAQALATSPYLTGLKYLAAVDPDSVLRTRFKEVFQ